jgi:hypothetical protein
VSINDEIKDTISTFGKIISAPNIDCENIIFCSISQNNSDKYCILKLSVVTGKIDTLLVSSTEYELSINNKLYGVDSCKYLISYDLTTGIKYKICEVGGEIYCLMDFDYSSAGLFWLGLWSPNEDYEQYYKYNLNTNTLSEVNLKKITNRTSLNASIDDISGKYLLMDDIWMDENFDMIQKGLVRRNIGKGFKINNNKSYYYLKSEIDAPLRKWGSTGVWLPCRFTLPFDLCLYKIYNNQLLTKEEIAGFDQWELHKLKNMVFAKHNYQFESHYLQAFYNLFQFYKGSVKDVNNLLTAEEQEN